MLSRERSFVDVVNAPQEAPAVSHTASAEDVALCSDPSSLDSCLTVSMIIPLEQTLHKRNVSA